MSLSTADRVEIGSLATSFFSCLDRFDDERLLSFLTPDICWKRSSGDLLGQAAVRAMLAQRERSRVTRHLVTNIDVGAAPDGSAAVTLDILVYQGQATPGSIPHYDRPAILESRDLFRHGPTGWRIALKQPAMILT